VKEGVGNARRKGIEINPWLLRMTGGGSGLRSLSDTTLQSVKRSHHQTLGSKTKEAYLTNIKKSVLYEDRDISSLGIAPVNRHTGLVANIDVRSANFSHQVARFGCPPLYLDFLHPTVTGFHVRYEGAPKAAIGQIAARPASRAGQAVASRELYEESVHLSV
jgi:hypothetical protein